MPFRVEAITALSSLKPNSRIHVIGVCGVAMAQIALHLSELGFQVSGSDKEFFEPMNSLLQKSKVDCMQGYNSEHISAELDLVVIGNSVTSSNVEVLACQEKGLAYTIFPKLLHELAIAGRHSIVVSGTHGKTTTSAMLAYVLEKSGQNPSYFVGGKSSQLNSGLKVGSGKISVVEGDEYDSSFFAKFAKFHFYKPATLIITSIEFDHADIYSDLEAIKSEFFRLVNAMSANTHVIACIDDPGVQDFISRLVDPKFKLITYGENPKADVVIKFIKNDAQVLAAKFSSLSAGNCELSLSLSGRYNLKNAVAGILALESSGIKCSSEVLSAFTEFKGVNRRQQVLLREPVILIEDFAHHPTAVKQTLAGIREWLPGRKLIAVFEPRSNTSRKKIFQADYVSSFQQADLVIIKAVEARALDKNDDLFDVNVVCQEISNAGVEAKSFDQIDEIVNFLAEKVQKDDIIVVMSNGSFGGLIYKLIERISKLDSH